MKKDIKDYIDIHQKTKQQHVEFIKDIVASFYNISPREAFNTKSRKSEVILVKHVAIYFIKKFVNLSAMNIGAHFDYDHATIIHALKKINNYLEWDKDFQNELNEISCLIEHKKIEIEGKIDLENDYYYISLNNVRSAKLGGQKAVIFTSGFTAEDLRHIKMIDTRTGKEIMSEGFEFRTHKDKKLYILEKKYEKDNN